MGWRDLLGKRPAPTTPILTVRIDDTEVAAVVLADLPCEIERSVRIDAPATVTFEDRADTCHRHHVPAERGWLHLNVRVHAGLACQADAVVTDRPDHVAGSAIVETGGEVGVRFQPFLLAGSSAPPPPAGIGLFARGLHFAGTVTPSSVQLSCECDRCGQTFLARSFHAGFQQVGYFYSASGRHTIAVEGHVEGAPVPLSEPDPAALAALEARLPLAPDGTAFAYRNPFRCPLCAAPYVDFTGHPAIRPSEYYGLYLPDTPLLHFDPAETAA